MSCSLTYDAFIIHNEAMNENENSSAFHKETFISEVIMGMVKTLRRHLHQHTPFSSSTGHFRKYGDHINLQNLIPTSNPSFRYHVDGVNIGANNLHVRIPQ